MELNVGRDKETGRFISLKQLAVKNYSIGTAHAFQGKVFKHGGYTAMPVQIGFTRFKLICLEDGNRWSEQEFDDTRELVKHFGLENPINNFGEKVKEMK